jgi:hypothetical protein
VDLVRVTVAGASSRSRGVAYTALAATAWSLAGILQRQLHMSLASQLAERAVFASLAVLAFVAVAERGQVVRALGPLWVWLAGIEHPSAPTIAGGVVVIGAVCLQVTQGTGSRGELQRPATQDHLAPGDAG